MAKTSKKIKGLKAFSLFSGIGGFDLALKNLGHETIGHCEIDKYSDKIYSKHFSDKNWGDVAQLNTDDLPDFDILVGGSPCQDLSIAKRNRKGLDGKRSGLFWDYVRVLEAKEPRYFILENVASMRKEDQDKITKVLGVEPIKINSAIFTAQQRRRLFWTNIPLSELPEDKGFILADIMENGFTEKLKSYCIDANYSKGVSLPFYLKNNRRQVVFSKPDKIMNIGNGGQAQRVYSARGKSVCLSARGGGQGAKTGIYWRPEGIRKLTPIECERLQGFPDNWTEGVSNTRRYIGLGNAVTVPVIEWILSHIKERDI